MTPQERIAEIKERLASAAPTNDYPSWLAVDDVQFLLEQVEKYEAAIAEQFAALGWQIASVEEAGQEMERLSAGWRAEAVLRIKAERGGRATGRETTDER